MASSIEQGYLAWAALEASFPKVALLYVWADDMVAIIRTMHSHICGCLYHCNTLSNLNNKVSHAFRIRVTTWIFRFFPSASHYRSPLNMWNTPCARPPVRRRARNTQQKRTDSSLDIHTNTSLHEHALLVKGTPKWIKMKTDEKCFHRILFELCLKHFLHFSSFYFDLISWHESVRSPRASVESKSDRRA